MRLNIANSLPLARPRRRSFFNDERRRLLLHAAKTALAAGLCWWLASRLGLHEGYWGAISAIIVLQSNVGATITASRDRLLGTLIGAVLGFCSTLYGHLPWNYMLAVLAAVILCGLLNLRESSRLAGVTVTIVMLVHAGSHWTVALDRVVDVFLGILVALAVSTSVFPARARLRLQDGLAREYLQLSDFFAAVLRGYRSKPPDELPALREAVLSTMRANNRLIEASRNEPAGSLGMREGLGLLNQFGRGLLDALIALEFAIRDSSDDEFAQQLEPDLGHLAQDCITGFHYVADCIRQWRFHVPPPGLHLEDDIRRLEERMDAIRHTGRNFPQPEILRAYAVQLYLRQVARLLRASRVQTNLALNEKQQGPSTPINTEDESAVEEGSE
jgi:uncharacterized membrane protein YccC